MAQRFTPPSYHTSMITSFLPPLPPRTDPATDDPSTSKDWMATLPAPSIEAVARTTPEPRDPEAEVTSWTCFTTFPLIEEDEYICCMGIAHCTSSPSLSRSL